MKKKLHSLNRMMLLVSCMLFISTATFGQNTFPSVDLLPQDQKITVTSATASASQPGEGIENSYDGSTSTIYHSPWTGTTFPITLTYNFNPSELNLIVYTTRMGGINGNFREFSISIKRSGETSYTKVLDLDLKGMSGAHRIELPELYTNVISVQFSVKSGATDSGIQFASCSEIGFFKANEFKVNDVFEDATCSSLKAGVTQAQISAINNEYYKALAQQLFDKTYNTEFRADEFKAWPNPGDFARNNRVGSFSKCDNPTGIYVRKGDKIAVFADNITDVPVTLCLKDYRAKDADGNNAEGNGYWQNSYFGLSNGLNIITADRDGLFYVEYFTPNHLTAPKVKLHFAFSKVAGYFNNQIHTKEDWTRILQANQYEYMDVLGDYAHLSFPTANFRNRTRDMGYELSKTYDELVYMGREFMGFYKYPNRNPYNRAHFVVMYHSYMYATSNHTGYHIGTIDDLVDVATLKRYPWGPAHEVGHTNQHRPLFKWLGTTEVTNNVQSLLVQTAWGNTPRLIEENRYQEAFDYLMAPKIPNAEAGIWQKLVPLWQIQLFFSEVLGQKDFYAKIYEGARTRETGSTAGMHQINFSKILVDSAKIDMTEFLDAWGFLRPVNARIDDYGEGVLNITTTQANDLKTYIKNKNFPVLPYKIQYITDVNKNIYINKLKVVEGTHSQNGNAFTPTGWQNVVAYECYRNGELVYIARGDVNKIQFPGRFDNTCELYAVQYDGEKFKMAEGFGNPLPSLEAPKFSTSTNENWYYLKNMSNEISSASGTPRGFCSLHATGDGKVVTGKSLPIFETQKWKIQRTTPTLFTIVNQDGLHLGLDMKATTTAQRWKMEFVSQQGSSGYRFVATQVNPEKPDEMMDVVPHLGLDGNLINYTQSDEASLWQFVPVDMIKITDDVNKFDYDVQTIRNDQLVADAYLQGNIADGKVVTAQEDGDNWNILKSTGSAVQLRNKDGKYLGITSTFPFIKDTPTNLYLYMTTYDGFVGLRIASGIYTTSTLLNVDASNSLRFRSTKDGGSIWNFVPSTSTSVKELNANASKYSIYVLDRKIVVSEEAGEFAVYSVSGQQMLNENLANGVYIVKGADFATKVLVK